MRRRGREGSVPDAGGSVENVVVVESSGFYM